MCRSPPPLPLLQVNSLLAVNVPARFLSAEMAEEERAAVMSELFSRDMPIKLLYITPERVRTSPRLCGSVCVCLRVSWWRGASVQRLWP